MKGKSPKGTVQIKNSNDRLQLVFRFGGKRYYFSLGLPDTKVNRKAAEAKAKLIESDIAYDRFDPTLAKYKPQVQVEPVMSKEESGFSLITLWEKYTDFKSTQVAASTIARDYSKIAKRIAKLPSKLESASSLNGVEIRDYLLKTYSSEVARRTLVQLNAASKWGVKSGLLESNPFEGLPSDIKKTHRDTSCEIFTQEERDEILLALKSNTYCPTAAHDKHSYYLPYVQFMFLTGTRPEEAIALEWKDVAPDLSLITIREALPSDVRIRGTTKTRKTREFPCNEQLQALLAFIKPQQISPNQYVLPGPRGGMLDSHNFLNRVWKPIVEGLVKEGKVRRYLPQYNIRHSVATWMLKTLSVQDVAKVLGNSPQVIYQNYAGANQSLVIPQL